MKRYELINGDCIEELQKVESEKFDFAVFSPPFADLYTYSDDFRDMGNSENYEQFGVHFGFLAKELYRTIKSGRNVAIHCMDLPIQKGKEGYIGLRDFSGQLIQIMQEYGFIYHSRVTIWKDPVIEMQRTKALGLLHKQTKKDSTMSRVGLPDYVLIFRKDGERLNPVKNNMSVDLWQKVASPVWYDINYSDTLNNYRDARTEKDEKHICPLQLPTIERLVMLYTNENDLVLTPFAGIGSELYQSLKMNRRAFGIELKKSYYEIALRNCDNALEMSKQMVLI